MLVRNDSLEPVVSNELRAGLLLLLHLCSPAQYGVDIAAAACAALVALMARDSGADATHSSERMRIDVITLASFHGSVFTAAMRHDGLAAALAQQRRDGIAVLATVAYQDPSDAAGEQLRMIEQNNAEVEDAFEASAVQVSPWNRCHFFAQLCRAVHLYWAGLLQRGALTHAAR